MRPIIRRPIVFLSKCVIVMSKAGHGVLDWKMMDDILFIGGGVLMPCAQHDYVL